MSPDGQSLVYVGERGSNTQLYHRPLSEVESTPIPDTEGAANPFFSPDGVWIGFKQGDTLQKVSLAGGSSVTICALPANPNEERFSHGAVWGQDDMVWFGDANNGLDRVAATGGIPQQMTMPDLGHRAPYPLPNGEGVLFESQNRIGLYVPETGDLRILTEGTRPWYTSSGHIVFTGTNRGTLWALPFDVDRLEPRGDPVPVRDGIHVGAYGPQSYFGTDGSLVYLPATGATGGRRLVWVDREGNEEPFGNVSRFYHSPRLSPDGTRVVVGVRDSSESDRYDIWVYDLKRDLETRVTDAPSFDWYPMWSPDGRRVVYSGDRNIVWRLADGTGPSETLVSETGRMLVPISWSRDHKTLLVTDWNFDGATGFDISSVSVEDGFRLEYTLRTEYREGTPEISPDGQWMAYVSNQSGRNEIYVRPYPDVERERIQVSTNGGAQPAWSPDGTELFYREPRECAEATPARSGPANDTEDTNLERCRKAMMAVRIDTEPSFSPGAPQFLFNDPYYSPTGRHYDVDSNGRRFLMIKNAESVRAHTVVRGWVEELEERVPLH